MSNINVKPNLEIMKLKDAPNTAKSNFHCLSDRVKHVVHPRWLRYQGPRTRRKPKKGGNVQKKRTGQLKNFMGLPLDIIYEVAHYLDPADLLRLLRATKDLRAVFLCRDSKAIWKRVLGQVPDLPACPLDMTEPQYGSYMFEDVCTGCGRTAEDCVDFVRYNELRFKLCKWCKEENLITASDTEKTHGLEALKLVTELIPFYCPKRKEGGLCPHELNTNKLTRHLFFRPEVDFALSMEAPSKESGRGNESTISSQKELVSTMVDSAAEMEKWLLKRDVRKRAEDEALVFRRVTMIYERLIELKWAQVYIPERGDPGYSDWLGLTFERKELTPRALSMLRWKLQKLYKDNRELKRIHVLGERFEGFYDWWRSTQHANVRNTLPGWVDIRDHPLIVGVLREIEDEDPHPLDCETLEEVTEQWSEELFSKLLPDAQIFRERVNHQLVELLKGVKSDIMDNTSQYKVLTRATTLFSCSCRPCLCRLFAFSKQGQWPYPEIVNHLATDAGEGTGLKWEDHKPTVDIRSTQVAEQVLAILGKGPNTSRQSIEYLEGRYFCACGFAPRTRPLCFAELVTHILAEQEWYEMLAELTRLRATETGESPNILINHHAPEHLRDLVRLTTATAAISDDDTWFERDKEPDVFTCCVHCFRLAGVWQPVEYSMREHHMIVAHGKDGAEDTDIAIVN